MKNISDRPLGYNASQMAGNFQGRRILHFQDGKDGEAARLITTLGGQAIAAGENRSDPGGLLDRISDGKVDILLLTAPGQVSGLIRNAAGAGREGKIREACKQICIASIDPDTTRAVAAAGLRADYEADPSETGSLIRELARRSGDLLRRKKTSNAHGVDTNLWRRIDAVWGPAPEPVFLRACRRQETPFTPVWIMRQAGRFQREYRDIRAKVPFLELCHTPELAAEVTLMAVDRLGVDAAILFADILLVLEPMGIGLRFAKGDGPVIDRPIRNREDLRRLPEPDAADLGFVYETVRLIRRALDPGLALIGFSGAPFTIASYIIEGGRSRNFEKTKAVMYGDPALWRALMERLTNLLIGYLNGQIEAGADAVQLFDSWVGCLCPDDYREYILPHMKRLIGSIRKPAPVIHFATGNPALLELRKEAGGDVIGVDWRVDLKRARQRLGKDVAVMGNLDPAVLLGPANEIRRRVKTILEKAGTDPGHIFNLGHGILPFTSPDRVSVLIDAVHELSAR